jgi:choline kinase
MEKISKAIIVAAGRGNRLRPLTDDKPKCLLEINGKTILQRQLQAYRKHGITEIIVVRGYKKELIDYSDIKYYDDINYGGILGSMFFAEQEMNEGFIFSYSDIIYGEDVVKQLLETEGDIVLVIDTDWREHYQGREKHPVSEAELVRIDGDRIVKIGKDVVGVDEAHGEFIGLAKFSNAGAKMIRDIYRDLINKYKREDPFQNAKEFQKAYLTDFIQELIDRGHEARIANITDGWIEIDTDEDFNRAKEQWKD